MSLSVDAPSSEIAPESLSAGGVAVVGVAVVGAPELGVAEARPTAAQRAGGALRRRALGLYYRLRFGRARFGARCDLRAGLHITLIGPQAQARFGADCVLDRRMTVECSGRLEVGARTIFGHDCTLAARELVRIGADCLIAEMVSVRDHDHAYADPNRTVREQGASVRQVEIGRNVWIGAKATIVKGVTIGDNAIIGANAVVTRDIPANAIAVGVPARVVKTRPAPK